MEQSWCILRTSGGKTLALADSLGKAGFEVWTPRKVLDRKRSKKTGAPEVEIAITPTFVFARSRHVGQLSMERARQATAHPGFSIFRFAGRIPLIADIDIIGFRAEEEAANLARRKIRHRDIEPGQRVAFKEGIYAGMTGVILKRGAAYSAVIFPDREVKIATWLASENVVMEDSTKLGSAAKAA